MARLQFARGGGLALNEKQERFVEYYFIHLDAAEAYRQAGYNTTNDDSTYAAASRLLSNVKVQERLRELREAQAERAQIEANEVLGYLTELYRTSPKDLYEWDADGVVTFKPSSELTRAQINSVQSIKHTVNERREKGGDVVVTRQTELKQYPRDKALELTMRHLALFNDSLRLQQSGDLAVRFKGLPSKPEPQG